MNLKMQFANLYLEILKQKVIFQFFGKKSETKFIFDRNQSQLMQTAIEENHMHIPIAAAKQSVERVPQNLTSTNKHNRSTIMYMQC